MYSDSDDNSSDDENERASMDSQYSQELANLTSEINLKQKLIEELEMSQRRLANLRQHYEDKLQQLQTKIKLTQDERDTVLSSLGNYLLKKTYLIVLVFYLYYYFII